MFYQHRIVDTNAEGERMTTLVNQTNKSVNKVRLLNDVDTSTYAGSHMLIDFWDAAVTEDPKELETILVKAAKFANSEPKKVAIEKFEPQGITAVIVLAESHISIHTWPELKYVALDIFTRGAHTSPNKALEYLKEVFTPERVETSHINRGKIVKDPAKEKVFGLELSLDLFDCDPESVRSKEIILDYSVKLCDLIEMKRYGKPFIERFAEHSEFAAGYSLAQMIETSLVSGHFSEFWNSAYINIFSCKPFDARKAESFTKEFFGAQSVKSLLNVR